MPLHFSISILLANTVDMIRPLLRVKAVHGYSGSKCQCGLEAHIAAEPEGMREFTYTMLVGLYENYELEFA